MAGTGVRINLLGPLEIVVDGISEAAVATAMTAAMQAATGDNIVAITAGNYGGQLGKYHFHLRQLLSAMK